MIRERRCYVACVWRDYDGTECDEPPPPAYSSHMSSRDDENVSIINFNFIWMFVIYWISLKLKAYMYWEWYHTFSDIYIHRNDMTVSCKSRLTLSTPPRIFQISKILRNSWKWLFLMKWQWKTSRRREGDEILPLYQIGVHTDTLKAG